MTPHRSNYPDPISFSPGDQLETGRQDPQHPGWVRVRTVDGNEGWAPLAYLERTSTRDTSALALQHYSARELDTRVGEPLVLISELHQWLLVENLRGEVGWVPAETTRPQD